MAIYFSGRRTGLPMLGIVSFLAAGTLASPAPPPRPEVVRTVPAAPSSARPPVPTSIRPAQPAPAPTPAFPVRSVLALDGPIRAGDYAWSEDGVPAGPTTIVVDIAWRLLYVYRGGIEIGRSSIIYGADNKPTPKGSFSILEKDADHVSNLYHVPMPYMLRLTMDGISIHASKIADDFATNGCIGIPDQFAALLFARARLGDRVLITQEWETELHHGYPAPPEAAG